ncbi:MaoC family dehydratase [Orrella sp. 11846]|uniref:MaoC family dehydratase n=1 Tax=Orrella sp. 11846 TaxID=3409913 RepID=UPI003B59F62A
MALKKTKDGIEIIGLGLHFDEMPLGRKIRTVGRTITEADLVSFVNATGFTEVLFTNTEFLREDSDIKGRLVPGALVFSMAEGLLMQAAMQHTGYAFLDMEMKVLGPTFVGNTIEVISEVIEARPSRSRPDRGLVRTLNQVVTEDGTVVMTYTPMRFVKRVTD